MQAIEIMVNSAQGVYIPQHFVESASDRWNYSQCTYDDSVSIVKSGPDTAEYWESWVDILDNATYTDDNGNVYALVESGDLFAVCEALLTDQEYYDFYGEERS